MRKDTKKVHGGHVVKSNALNHMQDSQSETKANNSPFRHSVKPSRSGLIVLIIFDFSEEIKGSNSSDYTHSEKSAPSAQPLIGLRDC